MVFPTPECLAKKRLELLLEREVAPLHGQDGVLIADPTRPHQPRHSLLLLLIFLNGIVQKGHIVIIILTSFFVLFGGLIGLLALLFVALLVLSFLLLAFLCARLLWLWFDVNWFFSLLFFARGIGLHHHSSESRGFGRFPVGFGELVGLPGQLFSIHIAVLVVIDSLLQFPGLSCRHIKSISSINFTQIKIIFI